MSRQPYWTAQVSQSAQSRENLRHAFITLQYDTESGTEERNVSDPVLSENILAAGVVTACAVLFLVEDKEYDDAAHANFQQIYFCIYVESALHHS